MLRSGINTVGGTVDYPDYVYYNADIINNETRDRAGGAVVTDPQIRFNETRDAPVIKDASQYYFSIVRFSMDGANRDLPLFIPNIQQGTGQDNVDLTSYAMSVSLQQTWNITTGAGVVPYTFNIVPKPRFIQYVPETQNPESAPPPRPLNSPNYVGQWNIATPYITGNIVATALDPNYGIGVAPFYQAIIPSVGLAPATNPQAWRPVSGDLGQSQDLSSRYYWVYTYQHWVDLWNTTMLDPNQLTAVPALSSTCCIQDLYNQFALAWTASGATDPFPYATLNDFVTAGSASFAPQMVYSPDTKRFRIYGDSDGFGTRITTFTPAGAGVPGATTRPTMRLFFNTNMFGLFANFDNTYWNTVRPTIGPFAGLPIWVNSVLNGPNTLTPEGYTNEILFTNKFWQNVADYRLSPYSGVPPLGFVPSGQQKVYWIAEQDYPSVDTLWSPISSIVFTSTLLPVKTEATGQPVILGGSNVGNSTSTVQNAFQPIITDITLPMSDGADDYRNFILYLPAAEYRLSDFTGSKQDIRNIDIQVFWKNRLDNNLYPINMFNLSSVSVKIMFRHKNATSGISK